MMKYLRYVAYPFALLAMRCPRGYAGREFLHKYYSSAPSDTDAGAGRRRVIYMCDGKLPHGGLTDRLKGLLTSYALARRCRRPFFIDWHSPFRLDEYLIPNAVDWRIDPASVDYSARRSFPAVMNTCRNRLRTWCERLIFCSWFLRDRELHVYSNLHFPVREFPELFRELFRPSDLLARELGKYAEICGGGKYWSFTFRFLQLLGDFEDCGATLPEPERHALVERCAAELKMLLRQLPAGYKALVTSDSATFLRRARELDGRIFVAEGSVVHPDHAPQSDSGGMFLKSFVDFFLIMGAERVYRLNTGAMYGSEFPKYAALIGGREYVSHYF